MSQPDDTLRLSLRQQLEEFWKQMMDKKLGIANGK